MLDLNKHLKFEPLGALKTIAITLRKIPNCQESYSIMMFMIE